MKHDSNSLAAMKLIGLRSEHLLEQVCTTVRAGGGQATALATHRIEPVADCPAAVELLDNPGSFDWTIFSSPNAVHALRAIARKLDRNLDLQMPVAGPGQQSARALAGCGFGNIAAPKLDSGLKALLDCGALGELAGRKIALVQRKDAPPRALEKLRRQQARPVAIECYRRIAAAADLWSSLEAQTRAECNCLLAFDEASLTVLLGRAGEDAGRLRRLPLGVHHPKIEAQARQLGFENIITQSDPKRLLTALARSIPQDAGKRPARER